MWRMLQQETPEDFVIATGEAHTVREMVEVAFDHAKLDWKKHVQIDPKYFRPSEVDELLGDATRAREHLGWQPKVRFQELVHRMVDHDIEMVRRIVEGHREKPYKEA